MKWNGGLVSIFQSCPGRQTCNWGLSLLAFCPSFDPWACPRSKQVADLVGHGVDSRWQFNEERDQRSPPYTWKPVCWVLKQSFSRPLLKTLIFILGLCYLACKRVRAHTCTPNNACAKSFGDTDFILYPVSLSCIRVQSWSSWICSFNYCNYPLCSSKYLICHLRLKNICSVISNQSACV